ncbi:M16 family metallopeptidase [Pseudoroseomonas wenyumeiae]
MGGRHGPHNPPRGSGRRSRPSRAWPPAASGSPARPFTPSAGEKPLFGAATWHLPNGLAVVHVENRRAPVVAHYVFYGIGGGDDPAGKSGLAHFLEHMMFKGSAHVASGAFSRRVAQEGGQDNAFTSRDVTAYHQHVEASRLPLAANMEADRMAAPSFPGGVGVGTAGGAGGTASAGGKHPARPLPRGL